MPNILRAMGGFFLDIFETLIIALSIFLIVYLFLMQPHQVSGQSMVPNFNHQDYVLTDKISYQLGDPSRGDIVVFHAPPSAHCPQGTGCDFIKRVLALPGETFEIKNNQIYINGQLLQESYLPQNTQTKPGNYTRGGTITLGPSEYMVIGDNRNYSSDSRAWGPIDKSMIVGRAFFRYWPPESVGAIKSAEYNQI